jgi:meso-butanediol dehydrogenase / (S,S)-butanediol dehydrogenase / diacetyl reductase
MTVRLGLEGRCGLVIEGTSEIGAACVQRLREEGMTICFTTPDPARGESLARRTGAPFIECDQRDRASCDRAVEHALDLGGGRLDVLVTAAGMALDGSIEATREADFRHLLEANLTAPFRIARACLPAMRAQGGGSIVHVASASGIRAAHERAAMSVAAAGLIAAAELFGAEGAADGVRANAVCPSDDVGGADVASLVAWLASDDSVRVTGATLRIDGGAGAAMLVDTRT